MKYTIHAIVLVTAVVFLNSLFLDRSRASQLKRYVMCKNGGIVRTIRIEDIKAADKTCITIYTKAGTDQEVGSGLNPSSCDTVLQRVQQTLESAAWKCKDVSSSQFFKEAVDSAAR